MGKVINAFPQTFEALSQRNRAALASVADHDVVPRYPTAITQTRHARIRKGFIVFGFVIFIAVCCLIGFTTF